MADIEQVTHEIEMSMMDFLREYGIEPQYIDVENYVDKILTKFQNSFTTLEELGTSYIEFEEMQGELERKTDAIETALCTLSNMKNIVTKMRESDTKKTLISYICDVQTDLED
ncbi:hypothetical protein [Methanobrevibacter sp.]|uniref:hypothetical protein n=1 Tax=Methanobrevibacter sp. TaxID=66852 RepID=UPI0038679025